MLERSIYENYVEKLLETRKALQLCLVKKSVSKDIRKLIDVELIKIFHLHWYEPTLTFAHVIPHATIMAQLRKYVEDHTAIPRTFIYGDKRLTFMEFLRANRQVVSNKFTFLIYLASSMLA